jgi:hypothetical protein
MKVSGMLEKKKKKDEGLQLVCWSSQGPVAVFTRLQLSLRGNITPPHLKILNESSFISCADEIHEHEGICVA